MAKITETIPFNFDDIYAKLVEKFEARGYDAPFEGSNLAQLITAMAYTTSMLNANTAANVNETILTLAEKRNNVLKDARLLGYEIAHKQSYRYLLTLKFPEGSWTVPKYSKFTDTKKNYYFMSNTISGIFTAQQVLDNENMVQIEVVEGNLKTFTENSDVLEVSTVTITDSMGNSEDQYYIDIPFVDVEENGIECFVTYYNADGILITQEEWTKSSQFMIDKESVIGNSFIRLDNIDYRTPRIYFKLAGTGTGIRIGSLIQMNVLLTSATSGAITGTLSTTLPGCSIFNYSLVAEGADEESLQSIKENAPLFYNSANRAITKSDYIAICNRQSSVNVSEVWGGEDELPAIPGNIWFSFVPNTVTRSFSNDIYKTLFSLNNPESLTNWFIEDSEIKSTTVDINGNITNPGIWDILDSYKVPTLIFHNRHPIYFDFSYDISILKYSITTSKADTHQLVFDIINDYFNVSTVDREKAESFYYEYFHSNLEKRIDIGLTDITGFENNLVVKAMLTSKNLITEKTNTGNKDILIPLQLPYENIFTGNNLNVSRLPNIDTQDFVGTADLSVDWSGLVGNEISNPHTIAPIKLGSAQVGNYHLLNNGKKYILVHLFVKGSGATDEYNTSTLLESDFNTVRYLDIKHYSPNFKMNKNTIPRLKSVNFQG